MKSQFSQTLSTTTMAANAPAILIVERVPVRPYAAHPQAGLGMMGFFGMSGTGYGDAGFGDTGTIAIQGRNASRIC